MNASTQLCRIRQMFWLLACVAAEAVVGAEYPAHTPFGFNGGFYYIRLGYAF